MSSVCDCDAWLDVASLQAEEKQALQRKQEAFMTEVEEWSQGEVEAVKGAAAARMQEAEQSAGQW
jgi:hypothetical protein